jgi:3-methyladenine DNA glycosylase/8-oxoguanine DNA glycosylase
MELRVVLVIIGIFSDFGLRLAAFTLPDPEQLERVGEKWRPYRTVAAKYLWCEADSL